MTKSVQQVLVEANELLYVPARWVKTMRRGYRNPTNGGVQGIPFNDRTVEANCWCLNGALREVCTTSEHHSGVFQAAEHILNAELLSYPNNTHYFILSHIVFNDDDATEFSDVKELLAKAIASCPRESPAAVV